ncbi:hypothetical protein Tco_1050970 [Tanacetum coccineum]
MSVISKFFYHAGVPAYGTDPPYFHKMLEMVGQYGQDLPAAPNSLDAIDFVKDAPTLFNILDKLADEMSEENVVQVIV